MLPAASSRNSAYAATSPPIVSPLRISAGRSSSRAAEMTTTK